MKDVFTRWNSAYKTIYESYEYKELLSAFANQYIDAAPLFLKIWINARDVIEVFKVFNDATYTFSLVYVPTSHIFCYTALQVAVSNFIAVYKSSLFRMPLVK